MGTPEQKYRWREWLRTITTATFIVVFGLLMGNMNRNVNAMKVEAVKTQVLYRIDYMATDYALCTMFDGEYLEHKEDKKKELLNDYNFKKGD